MVAELKSEKELKPKEVPKDPLIAFDAALEETGKTYKKVLAAPEERVKEEKKAAFEFVGGLGGYFGQLAEKGTYDELKEIPLDIWLRYAAEEGVKKMPADLEEKLKVLQGVKERLAKSENLLPEIKEDPKIKEAIEALRKSGEEILRERALLLKDWLTESAERRHFELEITEKSIREILDSPLFTVEVGPEEEKYADYKKRMIQEWLERAGRLPDEDYKERISQEWQKRGWMNRQLSEKEKKEADHLATEKAEGRDIAREAISGFTEEKLKNVIDIIEKTFESEEERHAAFARLKRMLDKITYHDTLTSDKNEFYASLDIELEKDEKEVPSWMISAFRECNEIDLFEKMVLFKNQIGSIRENLIKDQILRKKLNENSFGGKEVESKERLEPRGIPPKFVLQTWQPTENIGRFIEVGRLPKLNINPDLFIKAGAVIEMIDDKKLYDYIEKDTLKLLGRILKDASGEALFSEETGRLSLDKPKDQRMAQGWKEQIEKRISAEKPTGREEIEKIIQEHAGKYPIATVGEAVRLIEALKTEVAGTLKALQEKIERKEAEAKEAAGAKVISEREIRDLGNRIKELEEKSKGYERLYNELSGKYDASRKEVVSLQIYLKDAQSSDQQKKNLIGDIATLISKEVDRIDQIKKTFGADTAKKEALENLLKEIKNRLG